ncbi:Hypothetical predicted protein [Mytilus galloprovincialis]|uniref:Apextrin C-terminal domain-containing protein n=1 Tax=Mytilus galloprovincialis TaxID=29158 RepID=A0A8B6D7E4_MYTGA|nr:Hypothetical predicted protein [Mytilus galloprovincialis]
MALTAAETSTTTELINTAEALTTTELITTAEALISTETTTTAEVLTTTEKFTTTDKVTATVRSTTAEASEPSPDGTYSLMKPAVGCQGNDITWLEGNRYHDTEDDQRNNGYVVNTSMSGNFHLDYSHPNRDASLQSFIL